MIVLFEQDLKMQIINTNLISKFRCIERKIAKNNENRKLT